MAKKSRRTRTKGRVAEPVQRPTVAASQPRAAQAAPSRSSARQVAATQVVQPVNYDYVKTDLVRIGIIAGALILIIIILTFVPALRT
jgi:hypothetical protein